MNININTHMNKYIYIHTYIYIYTLFYDISAYILNRHLCIFICHRLWGVMCLRDPWIESIRKPQKCYTQGRQKCSRKCQTIWQKDTTNEVTEFKHAFGSIVKSNSTVRHGSVYKAKLSLSLSTRSRSSTKRVQISFWTPRSLWETAAYL